MAVLKGFEETNGRMSRDPEVAQSVLEEVATLLVNGETDLARLILLDLVQEMRAHFAVAPSLSPRHLL
jgi:hypothetical protein